LKPREVELIPRKARRTVALLLVTIAAVLLAAVTGPTSTSALPTYANASGQACGVCHINLADGGPRTATGQAFEAIPTHFTGPAGTWAQASSPTLAILLPTEGQVVTSTVTVSVQVTNFTLAPGAIGGVNVPDQGHWHILLDGVFLQPVGTDSFTLTGLTVGSHTIKAELHNNDHSAVSPAVEATVNITVAAEAPTLTIVTPTAGQVVTSTVTVRVLVTNFTLAPGAIGGANVAGQGHWHILLDGVFLQPVGTDSFTLTGLTVGPHAIKAELHNNDHSAVSPAVEATVNVTVAAEAPTLTIVTPTAGQVVTSTVTVRVLVTNFTLAPGAIGGANVAGQGHWHILLDGVFLQPVGTDSFTLTGLTVGPHAIKAELHNNDHSAVSPAVEATVSITVATVDTQAYLPQLFKNAGP